MLARHGEPEKFLGFAMVMLGNVFWREQFLAIPFERRMLLLPHCLKHAEGCPPITTSLVWIANAAVPVRLLITR